MSNAIVVAPQAHLVPEERAIAMVEACTKQLELAATIPDVQKVMTQAEAINAVMQKIKASKRAKKAALLLVVEAQRQLGRLTKELPTGRRGGGATSNLGQGTKRKTLAAFGISHSQANAAERLADVPREKVEAAVERSSSGNLNGVLTGLGIRKHWRDYQTPEAKARNTAFLATEAIELLERCVQTKNPPHAGTVAEMRSRLVKLTMPDA